MCLSQFYRNTLVPIIFLSPIFIHGQGFVDIGTIWETRGTYVQQDPFTETTTFMVDFFTSQIIGDTIIEGDYFQKVHTVQSGHTSGGVVEYDHLLKLDSNIVYYGETADDLKVLYDFNLEVGDTAIVPVREFGIETIDTVTVIEVDSINILGEYKKRITFSDFSFWYKNKEMIWVEDVGDMSYGFILGRHHLIFDTKLYCFWTEDTLAYTMDETSDSSSCFSFGYISVGGQNHPPEFSDSKAIPNPFNKSLKIKLDSSDHADIYIYDAGGKLVFEKHLIIDDPDGFETPYYTADLSNLNSGMYTLMVISPESAYLERIIKRRE